MMDLEEVKVCLRALLSSNPMSYHVNSLLNDFKNTTGFILPLFGHLNPVEFLKSMNDTVKLQGDPYNPEVTLVESKKSAHIISLVERQRVNDRNKNKSPYLMTNQRRCVVHNKNTRESNNLGASYLSWNPAEPKQLGSKEIALLSPITSQPFSAKTPKNTTQKFKPTLCAGVQPQPKIILPPKPKTAPLPPQTKTAPLQPQKMFTPPPTLLINTHALNQKLPKKFSNEEISFVPAPKQKESVSESLVESVDKIKIENCYFEDVSDNDNWEDTEPPSSNSASSASASSNSINNNIKDKLQKLIKNYPKGLWCCELPELFFKEFHFVLDYREYGYTSLIQMLSELPEVFRCIRPGNEDWILFDASVAPSAEEKKILDFQLRGDQICGMKANIQKLLSNCCENSSFEGVELVKISDMYEKMFGTALDFHSLGFKDLKSLLEIWEGSILNIVNVGGKLFCSPAFDRTVHSPVRWEEALPPITAENDIFLEIFPKDVVGPEETLIQLDLIRHIAVGHVVEVSVAEVWSPSKFFVQLNKFKKRLNRFMDDLQKFYNIHLNKYKMPDSTLRPNQVCVGLYNADSEYPDEWHRAQIIKVINDKTVLINFVDYGTVTRVKKTQLRFLHRSFQSFPVQAFQAQLSGVVPPNDEALWPMTTSKKFLELLRVPYLNAEMIDIDFKKPVLSVVLFDPLQKSNINQILVQDKLARSAEPLYFQEDMFLTKIPEKETKGLSECSSSALVQANESFSEIAPEITDQFLDIDDLSHSTLIPFKMKSLSPDSSPTKEKDRASEETVRPEEVTYEFDYIPDLTGDDEEKDTQNEAKKRDSEEDAATLLEPDLPEREETLKTPAPAAALEEKLTPTIAQPETPPDERTTPTKSKRLPPGLEHVSALPDFTQIPLLLQHQDLKKKINILAMELLTKNASIMQVGINDPALALQIATEMAKAYLSSEVSGNLLARYDLYSVFPQAFVGSAAPSADLSDAKPCSSSDTMALSKTLPPKEPEPPKTADEGDGPASIMSSPEETTPSSSPAVKKFHPRSAAESKEYIEEAHVGGKILHLVKVDNELYFSSEEVVHQFTSFSNREIADRILRIKKIKPDYKIICKKSDERVLNAVKSNMLPGVVKRKAKKLKVYLLPVAKVLPFLEALGCGTKTFENDILELQKSLEGRNP